MERDDHLISWSRCAAEATQLRKKYLTAKESYQRAANAAAELAAEAALQRAMSQRNVALVLPRKK